LFIILRYLASRTWSKIMLSTSGIKIKKTRSRSVYTGLNACPAIGNLLTYNF